MFDLVTENVIRSSLELPGLSPDDLIQQLTAVHVEIATARLLLGAANFTVNEEISSLLSRLARLADTYESRLYAVLCGNGRPAR